MSHVFATFRGEKMGMQRVIPESSLPTNMSLIQYWLLAVMSSTIAN
jgi:hypothetical protein